jgi:hypothetical protein
VPVVKVVLIEFVTEDPAMTDWLPELEREKLKGWLTVYDALASPLALYPVLNAFAFTTALLVKAVEPV